MSFNFLNFESKLEKAFNFIAGDISTLRTGRATVQILDPVMVEAYGAKMRIAEVASVQAPDASMLVVTPWDKGLLSNIEKAISTADLNLNPVVDGDIIRIKISSLTEEKRKEMVKILYKKIEAGRVMFRTLRSDNKKEIEKQKGNEGVSEDDIKLDIQELDNLLKKNMEKLDDLLDKKEDELLTV